MMLFALGEPEEGDGHNVLVDRVLMSPGRENDKLPQLLIVGGWTPRWVRFGLGFEKRCFAAAEE